MEFTNIMRQAVLNRLTHNSLQTETEVFEHTKIPVSRGKLSSLPSPLQKIINPVNNLIIIN